MRARSPPRARATEDRAGVPARARSSRSAWRCARPPPPSHRGQRRGDHHRTPFATAPPTLRVSSSPCAPHQLEPPPPPPNPPPPPKPPNPPPPPKPPPPNPPPHPPRPPNPPDAKKSGRHPTHPRPRASDERIATKMKMRKNATIGENPPLPPPDGAGCCGASVVSSVKWYSFANFCATWYVSCSMPPA